MRFKELVEMTSAGGFATVAMPLGDVQKRRKEQSIYNEDDVDFAYASPTSKEDYLSKKKELYRILSDSASDTTALKIAQQYIVKLDAEAEELGFRI
jgi:hypothetical protein